MTQAYAKRRYLIDYIERKREVGKTLEESAAALDVALGTNTLTFRLRQLQAEDDTIVRRVKRRRVVVDTPEDDPEATPPRARRRYMRPGAAPRRRQFPPPGITIDGVPRAQWAPNRHVGRWEATAITGPGRLTGFGNDFV